MPESFSSYLESRTRAPSFTDYLSNQNIDPSRSLSFSDYLADQKRLDYSSRSVLPSIEDLKPLEPLGLGGAFASGLKGGFTLGWGGTERTPEEMAAMTAGESFTEALGHITGGSIPFILASIATGGYGAPIAGAAYMKNAYTALKGMSKLSKIKKTLEKSRVAATQAVKTAKGRGVTVAKKNLKDIDDALLGNISKSTAYEKEILGYKRKYIEERISAGAKKTVLGRMELARLAKSPAFPKARGLLGVSKSYQKWVAGIAQNHGPKWANLANKFVNSAGTFASVGLVSNKPGASILDRIADIPKDVAMGAFFTAANMPRIFGVKGGAAYEPVGIMGIGAYGDYLTLSPDPDMDIRDRLIHGLALTTFHYVAKGLSNIGVKDQVYNALLGIGFDEPVAFQVAYRTKMMDDGLKVARKEHAKMGVLYQHNKDPKNMIAVTRVRKGGEEGEAGGVISYRNMDTGEMKVIQGSTLTRARDKLQKKYHKFEPESKKHVDDLPEHMRENVDLFHVLEKEVRSMDIERTTAKSKKEHKMWERRMKSIDEVMDKPRMFTLKKVDASKVEPDRTRVIDVRKDHKAREKFMEEQKAWLTELAGDYLENPDNFMKGSFGVGRSFPKRLDWMNHYERKVIISTITNLIHGSPSWFKYNPKKWIDILHREINDLRDRRMKKPVRGDRYYERGHVRRAVEPDYPVQLGMYKKGTFILIPKILGHNRVSEYGTGKGFDNTKFQIAEVIEPDYYKLKPDAYVPHIDPNVIRVRTVNLNTGEKVELNVRLDGKTTKDKYDSIYKVHGFRLPGYDVKTQHEGDVLSVLAGEWHGKRERLLKDPKVIAAATRGYDSKGRPIRRFYKEEVIDGHRTGREIDLADPRESLADQLPMYWKMYPEQKIVYDHTVKQFGKPGGYKELSLGNKEFLNARGQIEPEIYNTKMFSNASRLTRGMVVGDFWTPKLEYMSDKGVPTPFDLKTFAETDRLIFDDKLEAQRRMRADWEIQESSNLVLASKRSRAEANMNKAEYTPEWSEFRKQEKLLGDAFVNQGISGINDQWARKAIIDTIYPEVKQFRSIKEKLGNLSLRQIVRIRNFIEEKNTTESWYDSQMNITPDDWHSRISPKYRKLVNLLSRFSLPSASVFEPLGRVGPWFARASRRFSKWRTNMLGIHIATVNAMGRELKSAGVRSGKLGIESQGSIIKYVNKYIHAWMDKDYAPLQNSPEYAAFRKNMENHHMINPRTGEKVTALDYTQKMYQQLYKQMALAQVLSHSYVRNTKKNGKQERFMKLHDMEGNEITLPDYIKDSDNYIRSANSMIKWAENDKVSTVQQAKDGKLVRVKVDTKHPEHSNHFQKDYSRRVLSERLKELISDEDQMFNEAVRHAAKNDKDFQHIKDEFEREDAVRAHLLKVKNMVSDNHVYGQQHTRVADLPAYFYAYRVGDKINLIQLGKGKEFKSDGGLYKEGDVIKDIHGQSRKVSEIIPTYETEYGKLLQNYSEGVAHSSATYFSYGNRHTPDLLTESMAKKLGKEMGDKYYEDYALKVTKSQIYGEKERWFDKLVAPTVRLNAIVGLSSPLSGLKNLLLGNVQNVTVFTSRELLKAANHVFSKGLRETWKAEKEIAERIGATYAGAYDLYLTENIASGFMKRFLPNIGLMRTTEIMNRVISSTVGPFALDIHVANIAGIKTPSTRGLNSKTSKRVLMDVFDFTPDEIVNMIERRRTSDAHGKKMQFTAREENKARQQAHLVTQGSGELPYVPFWMGQNWAKPLTLFYRIAYRMTETVGKNVVKPIIVDGNMVPAMKYMTFATGTGYSLYQVYSWLFDEERVNKFKSMPSNMFTYFIKAEGLAMFSNAFDEYGGVVDSYKPVVLRNTEEFFDELEAFVSGKKTFGQAAGDGLKRIVSVYNTADRAYQMYNQDNQKKFLDSRRRQTQYLDAFYPKEKLDIDFDSALTSKSAYYRALKDVFWYDKMEDKAQRYYSALSHLTHRIMIDNRGMTYRTAQKEARTRLKRTISRMRPIPTSWRKTKARTMSTRYREYMSKLNEGDRAEEETMDSLYMDKRREFWQAIREYRNKYYKEG